MSAIFAQEMVVLFAILHRHSAWPAILSGVLAGCSRGAAIGDDWPDLPLLQCAGFSCAVANAHAEVRAVAQYVTALSGGRGAPREFCDLLLIASGRYAGLLQAQRASLDTR